MKKLFLAVALVAATISANAADATIDATVLTASADKELLAQSSVNSYFTVEGTVYKRVSGTTGLVYAIDTEKNGAGAITFTAASDALNFSAAISSTGSANTSDYQLYDVTSSSALLDGTITGSSASTITVTATLIAGHTYKFLAPTTGANTGRGVRIYSISVTAVAASSNDAISSDLLKQAGDKLVNPTNLAVEVYSLAGVKVLSSSDASINVSGLSGTFVAKTAEGSLKFVK